MPFGNKDSSSTGSSWFCPFNLNTFLTGEFKSPLVCIHRSWLTSKAASLTFLHPSGMKKLLLFTILRFVSTSQHGWNHKRQTMRMIVIVFVYLFSTWPLLLTAVSLTVWGWQFTSVYLDSQAVVVWIWIMNPFLIPFRSCWVPVAMATVHRGSERHLVR